MATKEVKIKDKTFVTSISEETILRRVKELAEEISRDYADKNPLFLAVLNGSFVFAADLMRDMAVPCEISFVKLASYQGTMSTGKVKEVIGINEDLCGRHLIILEDIIETGTTMKRMMESLAGQMLIPVPVLGAVIGNTIGTLLYQIGKDSLTKKEQAIFAGYISEINTLDQQLEEAYRSSIDRMNAAFASYMDVLAVAFVPDVLQALQGSAKLAKTMGVPTEEILDTREKVFSYFMD